MSGRSRCDPARGSAGYRGEHAAPASDALVQALEVVRLVRRVHAVVEPREPVQQRVESQHRLEIARNWDRAAAADERGLADRFCASSPKPPECRPRDAAVTVTSSPSRPRSMVVSDGVRRSYMLVSQISARSGAESSRRCVSRNGGSEGEPNFLPSKRKVRRVGSVPCSSPRARSSGVERFRAAR